jgi:hypothetical protein
VIRGHIKPTKILSKAARAAIEKAVRSGDFKHRPTNATEPPLMRPSTKPDDYSMVSEIDPAHSAGYTDNAKVVLFLLGLR